MGGACAVGEADASGMPLSPSPPGKPLLIPQHPGQGLLACVILPAAHAQSVLPLGARPLLCALHQVWWWPHG